MVLSGVSATLEQHLSSELLHDIRSAQLCSSPKTKCFRANSSAQSCKEHLPFTVLWLKVMCNGRTVCCCMLCGTAYSCHVASASVLALIVRKLQRQCMCLLGQIALL